MTTAKPCSTDPLAPLLMPLINEAITLYLYLGAETITGTLTKVAPNFVHLKTASGREYVLRIGALSGYATGPE